MSDTPENPNEPASDAPDDQPMQPADSNETRASSSLKEESSESVHLSTVAQDAKEGIATSAVKLYGLIVRRPVAVSTVALAFTVFGLVAFLDLPVKLMPDMSYPTLTVRTDYPTAHPKQVEEDVSEPIQDRVGNIPGLKGHSSTSRQEQSDIVLEFEWGTDMSDASTRVQEAINRVRLDRAVETPQILRFDPAQDPIMRLMLYKRDDSHNLAEMRKYAEDRLKPELSKLPGVATVRVSGGLEQRLKITPLPRKLASHGLDATDIRRVCQSENIDSSVGLVDDRGRTVLLRVTSQFRSKYDIENLIVPLPNDSEGNSKGSVKMSEIALVEFEDEEPESITRYANADTEFNSQSGVLLEVLKMGDANIIDVAATVRKALYGSRYADSVSEEGDAAYPDKAERDEIAREARETATKDAKTKTQERGRRGQSTSSGFNRESEFGLLDRMPKEMGLSLLTDQSVFIQASVDEVGAAAFIGGLLAIAIIFLFLRSVKSTFLIALSIGLSVVATFIPMGGSQLSLNLMSLGGLALGIGMLVDNSIVVLESIARCREEGDDAIGAAARGTGEVASAIIASTLTTIAVFVPIVFVEGMVGQVFKEQSLTVVFSLLASLVVALLVIPAYAGIRFGTRKGVLRGTIHGVYLGMIAQFRWGDSQSENLIKSPIYILNTIFVALLLIPISIGIFFALLFFGTLFLVFLALKALFSVTMVPLALVWQGAWKAIEATYSPMLRAALEKPAVILGISIMALVLALGIGSNLETELIPPLNENEFYVDIEAPEGTRLNLTDKAAIEAIDGAAQDEKLRSWVRGIMVEVGGDASTTNRPVSSATVRYVVNLDAGAPSVDEVGERIKTGIEGVETFETKARVSRPSLFSLKRAVVVQVRGNDLRLLDMAAAEIAATLREITADDGGPLLKEVKTSTERGSPQIQIQLDAKKLLQKNITKSQVADALSLLVGGETITDYEERGERTDVFLSLEVDRDAGRTLDELRAMTVAPGVRLEELLTNDSRSLQPIQGPSRILRTETEKVVEVTATPNGVALGRVRELIAEAVSVSGVESDDVRITLAGQMAELEESNASLYFALALAIFLVYVVMAVQFESLIDPLLIMGSVPLAAVGVILMLWMTSAPISVIVMLGAIVLAGIVVNNAIVLVDYANRLRAQGIPTVEAVHQAGCVRLRPIAITTITTVLGMLPMTGWIDGPMNFAMSSMATITVWAPWLSDFFASMVGSGDGQELRAPMAQTVVIGLSTSTVLTLLVIPTLYALVHGSRKERQEFEDEAPKDDTAEVVREIRAAVDA